MLSLGLLEEEDDFCCFRSLRLAEEDGGGTVLVGGGAVFDVEDEVLRVGRLLVEDERLDSSCEDSWSGLSLICSALVNVVEDIEKSRSDSEYLTLLLSAFVLM